MANTYTSTIKLEGVEELAAMLRVALLYHDENKVRKSLAKGSKVVIDEAKRLAPVESGMLRDSIKVMPKFRNDPKAVYFGPKVKMRRRASKRESQRTAKTGGIEVDAYYAHFVEYGTDPHNLGYKGKYVSGKGADHPGSKKKPYMRPAYDSKGQEAITVSINEIWKMIEDKVQRSTINNIMAHKGPGGKALY